MRKATKSLLQKLRPRELREILVLSSEIRFSPLPFSSYFHLTHERMRNVFSAKFTETYYTFTEIIIILNRFARGEGILKRLHRRNLDPHKICRGLNALNESFEWMCFVLKRIQIFVKRVEGFPTLTNWESNKKSIGAICKTLTGYRGTDSIIPPFLSYAYLPRCFIKQRF